MSTVEETGCWCACVRACVREAGWTRTVREELAEHEGVVGLGVVLGKMDVFVHVEGDDVLEAGSAVGG